MTASSPTNLPTLSLSAAMLLLASTSVAAQTQTSQPTTPPPATTDSEKKGAQFESSFLHRVNGQTQVDLSVFSHSNRVLPGMHSVFLRLNSGNSWLGKWSRDLHADLHLT